MSKQTIKLLSNKEHVFTVDITKKQLTIVDRVGDWATVFSCNTRAYALFQSLANENNTNVMLLIARTLYYMSRTLLSDVSGRTIKEFWQLLDRHIKRVEREAPQISKEEDDKILAEQRVLHEKDAKSVDKYTYSKAVDSITSFLDNKIMDYAMIYNRKNMYKQYVSFCEESSFGTHDIITFSDILEELGYKLS